MINPLSRNNLRNDLFGGVTTAIVSLPLALTFGVASGAGPAAGLWGAVLVGLFAALFGGTPTLISEPTGPMTVLMTAVLAGLIAADPENGLALAFTAVMVAGLFQIGLGWLKLGRYFTLMPYSVISGFMSGIGVILILLQIPAILGQANPGGGVVGVVRALPDLLRRADPAEALLGAITLALLFGLPARLKRYAPPPLIALVVGTALALTLFADADLRQIGPIPTGLPTLRLPTLTAALWTEVLLDGMILGVLGAIDTLLTALIANSLTRTEHDANRELVGQGIGNLAAGLLGGLPGAGATMGTVVNIQSGARTSLAGVIRALILLTVVLGVARLAAVIPLAVLAAIALHVGVNILDWSFLKRAHRLSRTTALIMYGVLLLTVFVDLIVAVGVGVFIANVLTIERLSALQERNVRAIGDADDSIPLDPDERRLLDRAAGRILLLYLSGPMIFGVAKAIGRSHTADSAHRALVIDLSDVGLMGTTVGLAIENVIRDALEAGRHVFLVLNPAEQRRWTEQLEIGRLLPAERILTQRRAALAQAAELIAAD